jgi:hypothetical protein
MAKCTNRAVPSPPSNVHRTRSKGLADVGHTLSQVEHQARELKKRQGTLPQAGSALDEEPEDLHEVKGPTKKGPAKKGKNVHVRQVRLL